ncbi:MAG: hypothetical protein MJZ49_04840 [Bacteroidales bacterium]|nr:hypothetical protein [Bacteroidales bacterium]
MENFNCKIGDPTRILKAGTELYRYDLSSELPKEWSTDYKSKEYDYGILGCKNKMNAFFFYDIAGVAESTGKWASFKTGVDKVTLTSTKLEEDVIFFDLASKSMCDFRDVREFLDVQGIDVLTDDFKYAITINRRFSNIRQSFQEYRQSTNICQRCNSISKINRFFKCMDEGKEVPVRYLLQSLSDFDNGIAFKKLLTDKQYEGYCFSENDNAITYCLFQANKLSAPCHEIIKI